MSSRSAAIRGGAAALTAMLALALPGQPAEAGPVSAWSVVPSPNPSLSANRLRGTASLAPGAVWSVGTWRDDTGRQRTLTQRWDGAAWRTVDSPGTGTGYDTLTAVAGTSPAALWAVGFTARSAHDPDNPADPDRSLPLMLRGDGDSWTLEPLDTVGTSGHLSAVDMTHENDGWAVGSHVPPDEAVPRGLILRWTGTAWRQVPAPDTGPLPVHLTGVRGTSADDVWAVGYLGSIGSTAEALVLHWNGQHWLRQDLDIDRSVQSALFAVAARSADDVWAVGYTWQAGKRVGFALRRSGRDWQRVPVSVTEEGTQLRGVVALATGVWAVGYYVDQGVDNALVMSFDGAGFVKEAPPAPPAGPANIAGTAVTGIAATTSTGELWAVGCLGYGTRVLRRNTGVTPAAPAAR